MDKPSSNTTNKSNSPEPQVKSTDMSKEMIEEVSI